MKAMTITVSEARAKGYSILAGPYNLPREMWMLGNIVNDLERGRIAYRLVGDPTRPEVWRR